MRNCVATTCKGHPIFLYWRRGYIGSGFYLGKHDLGMHGVCVLDGIHCLQLSLLAPKATHVVEITLLVVEITLLVLARRKLQEFLAME
jgi:hypothetical protein